MTSPRASSVKRLGAVFQQAGDAVFLLDRAGRFAYVNPAWEGLTGLDADSVLGQAPESDDPEARGWSAFVPPPEALAGRPSGGRSLIAGPNGDRLWRRVEFWPYRDAQGQILAILGLVRDDSAAPHAPDSPAQQARAMLAEAREAMRARYGHASIVGRGPRHDRLMAQVDAASRTDAPAFLVGEPGTGKKSAAEAIAARSAPPGSAFVAVDVEALPEGWIERELFPPAGSTLFLAHCESMPRDAQARLVEGLHASRVRVLCGTTVDPEKSLREGKFREDFYFATSVQVLRLAPLRERIEEIPLLAQHFLELACAREPRRNAAFSPAAIDVLTSYDWPGNLRELARVIDASRARAADVITPDDLPAEIRGELASAYVEPMPPPAVTSLDELLTRLERRMIEQALHRARHNKSRAAELLDISRPRLYRRIKELDIHDPDAPEDVNGRRE